MKSLSPAVKEDVQKYWVVAKTKKPFSTTMPIDQAHEQNNAIVKDSGGAVGLSERPTAFQRWMVSGPEFARLLGEFQAQYLAENDPNAEKSLKHHANGISAQDIPDAGAKTDRRDESIRKSLSRRRGRACEH